MAGIPSNEAHKGLTKRQGSDHSESGPAPRPRVLFFAEAVTLAHIARPLALAGQLRHDAFEVFFACDVRCRSILGELDCAYVPMESLSAEQFRRRLAGGAPVYDTKTLYRYVQRDLQILEEVAPDVVVGDFRLSLSVSASLAAVPWVSIGNAYWSPYADPLFPVPELPLTRLLGRFASQVAFDLVRPLAFAYHARPLNRVRRHYGLQSLGPDLRRVYNGGDWVLYADIPDLVPTRDLPHNHRYIGPIPWSPPVGVPDWWNQIPADQPWVYVNLGSSGDRAALATVLEGLASLPVAVVAATAGQPHPRQLPANVWLADYLPGEQVAAKASAVVCNGGSPTAMQALSAGVPIVGIPHNLDQYANMAYMERAGVGILLPAGTTTPQRVQQAVTAVLDSREGYREKAAWAATRIRAYVPAEVLEAVLGEAMSGKMSHGSGFLS